jgi:hypothetical protein
MLASKFLQRRAVDIRAGGRYCLASRHDFRGNRREFACRTTRMSPFQMLVAAPVVGPVGERVISYFGEFGKLDGWITDVIEGGFLVDIEAGKKKRAALAAKLAWLEKRQNDPSVVDVRQQKRLIPENPHSVLTLGDGTALSCFIIDMSPSGVAVSADIEIEIGARLAVGCSVGQVVRLFGEGFAVQFDRLQDPARLEQMLRQSPGLSAAPALETTAPAPSIAPKGRDDRPARDEAPAPRLGTDVWYL